MSTFNINRFEQALKCQLMVGRKMWIRLFSIFTLVMFMAGLFWTRIQGTSYELMETWGTDELYQAYERLVRQSVSFGLIFFCIAMLFGASGMFSQMKDTPKRSAYLLWPVSNLEKYVISILLSIVLMAVVTVGAFFLADALRVFVDWVTGRIIVWGFPILFDSQREAVSSSEERLFLWMVLTFMFYFHSLYIVGGTLFRRQQFLLTSGTIIIVSILLTIILNHIDWSGVDIEFVNSHWDEETQTYIHVFHPLFYIINTVGCLLIVFHYWASYKLFTRMQVINNKWLNV
jgi:hypothetical protein